MSESAPEFKGEQLRLLPPQKRHVCQKKSLDDEFCGYCGKRLQTPRGPTTIAYSVAIMVVIGVNLLGLYSLQFGDTNIFFFILMGGSMLVALVLFLVVSLTLRLSYRAPVRHLGTFELAMGATSVGFAIFLWMIAIFLSVMGGLMASGGQ